MGRKLAAVGLALALALSGCYANGGSPEHPVYYKCAD